MESNNEKKIRFIEDKIIKKKNFRKLSEEKIKNSNTNKSKEISLFCPYCGCKFHHNIIFFGKVSGMISGALSGAYLGSSIGIAGGPLGAIAGTIPGAVLGSIFGKNIGGNFDKPKCPNCKKTFKL